MATNGDAGSASHYSPRELALPPLSDVARILQNEMKSEFRELNVDIAACPCLTREPFNLAGVGLSGNTSLIEIGDYETLRVTQDHFANWNISAFLSNFYHDSFVIGAGFASQPYMPYNGHLIMNATYRAPENITNASRIVFADASNGQRRIETLTDPNELKCSFMGNIFLSEGRQGSVIRVRAKGRKTNVDIISTMQDILYRHYFINKNSIIALGGILKMKNGRVAYNVMPEQYPEEILSFGDLARWYQCHDINLESELVAVGALMNIKPEFEEAEQRYGFSLPTRRYHFHSFSNYGAGGQFISDITGDETDFPLPFNSLALKFKLNIMEDELVNGDAWTTINLPFMKDLKLPTLSNVKGILQDKMEPMFCDLKVDISACPCLTREPFNLAGVGLCGKTSLIIVGGYSAFMPSPRYDTAKWDLRKILSRSCYDSFIIGAGYAAKPYLPYNGHLIMNAMYRAPANIKNASRIIFAETSNGQRRIETLTEPNQLKCSLMGNFFVSEGRQGNIIRVRAKGRKSNLDIITIMQQILYEEFYVKRNQIVALGGVLKMRNGRVAQNVMPEEYPLHVSSFGELAKWFQCHEMFLESDLIAVGTLVNTEPKSFHMEKRYGFSLPARRYHFHSFSNYGAGGQFISDITGDVTEYEGYFNLASKICYEKYNVLFPFDF